MARPDGHAGEAVMDVMPAAPLVPDPTDPAQEIAGAMPALFLSHATPPLVDDPRWVTELESLAAFRDRATGTSYAHPTIKHVAPMLVALDAATDPGSPPGQPIDGFWMGLAKRLFQVA